MKSVQLIEYSVRTPRFFELMNETRDEEKIETLEQTKFVGV